MKRYDLYENTREMSYKKRNEIKEGCTVEADSYEPELIKSFDNSGEALQELAKRESDIQEMPYRGMLYRITEYYVQENEYDEDGEWCGGGDILGFSLFDERSLEIMADF